MVSPKIAHGVNGRVRRQVHTQPDSHGPQVLIKTTIKLAARSIWQAVIVILGGIWTKVSGALLLQSVNKNVSEKGWWMKSRLRKEDLPSMSQAPPPGWDCRKTTRAEERQIYAFLTSHPLPHGSSGFSLGLLTENYHVPWVWTTLLATLGLQLTEGLLRNFSSYSHACQSP